MFQFILQFSKHPSTYAMRVDPHSFLVAVEPTPTNKHDPTAPDHHPRDHSRLQRQGPSAIVDDVLR